MALSCLEYFRIFGFRTRYQLSLGVHDFHLFDHRGQNFVFQASAMRPSGYGAGHCDIRYGSKIGQAHAAVLLQCLVDLGEFDASLYLDGPCLWVQRYYPFHLRTQVNHVNAFFAILL